MSLDPEVTVAVHSHSRVGEGPVWHRDRLLWVDILAGQIHDSDLSTGTTESITVPTWVGAAAPMASGGYIAATREGFATIIDGNLDTFAPFLPPGIRMNDAKCDPFGRFWAGSCAEDFAPGAGALHRLEPDLAHHIVLEGLTQPNGIGWSPDGRTMYLIDTQECALYSYAFDLDSGRVGERRVVARFDAGRDGYPDGLAVDEAGFIWIAMWAGGTVLGLSPDGEVHHRLAMPVSQPTSCAFVGDQRADLVVTSASEGLTLDADALDGSVFLVQGLGARGVPVAAFGGAAC